jgi:hypothetical protein
MCLRLNPFETPETATKIAGEDITCYKILKGYNPINNEIFISLYQDFKYVIGEKYQNTGLGFRLRFGSCDYSTPVIYEVYEAFHSFKCEETTLFELDEYSKQRYSKIVAVKCTIPKGSKYVENDVFYASDAIIIDKVIGEYKNKMKIII